MKSIIESTFAGKIPLFETRIPRSIKVGEVCLYQQTICEYMPDNPAAVAYENFVKELMEHGNQSA